MHDAPSQRPSPRPKPPPPRSPASSDKPIRLLGAARSLMQELSRGRALTAPILRDALTAAFGGTDAEGAWVWKDAYDAAEAAIVLFLKRYGMAMRRQAGAGPGGPAAMPGDAANDWLPLNLPTRAVPRNRSACSSFPRPCRWPMLPCRLP